ncbi:MAG: DUF4129 domain-containing transglutaminase family protein [Candidatus Zipacnadales bacterium]
MERRARRVGLLLPFYGGLLLMAGSAIGGLGLAIDTPDFTLRAYILMCLGLLASYIGAITRRNPAVLGALIGAIVFPLLVLSNTGAPITRLFFPDETLTEHSLLLPTLAVWGIIALSFAQVTRLNSIFIFVCGLVVFGLTGTVNINESLLVSFFLFLLSAFFVWAYNGVLNLLELANAAGQTVPLEPWRWAHTQAGVAVALLAIVFASSVVVGYPIYESASAWLVSPFMRSYQSSKMAPPLRDYTGFSEQFSLTGGPIELSDRVELTVHANSPALWRGLAYDYYTGRGWERTDRGEEYPLPEQPPASGTFRLWPGYPHSPQTPHVKTVRQRFHLHGRRGGVLLGAAQPVSIRSLTHRIQPYIDMYGCFHGRFRITVEPEYEIVSTVATPTAAEMAAAPSSPDAYPDFIRARYLQVPLSAQARLQDLADEITAGCTNAYAKAQAIETYLYENCRYTLNVPPIPAQQDAVAYFLLTTKQGACDLYASALVMLLRLSGVPARIVTGYSTGKWDPMQGLYVVTGQDSHAWAEVFFPGVGWVEFDPPSQKAPERFSWLTRLFQPGWTVPTLQLLGRRALVGFLILFALNALLIAISGVSPLSRATRWLRYRRALVNPRQRVAVAYLAVCEQLRRQGIVRYPWQTPTDYLWEVSARHELPEAIRHIDFPTFTHDFLRLRYAESSPDRAAAEAFAQQARTLARKIRRSRRTRTRSHTPEPTPSSHLD